MASAPAWLIRALLVVRSLGTRAADPLDRLGLLLNGKAYLPPLSLRRYAGPLATAEASGAEFVAYLKLLCGLDSRTTLVDVGCGYGLVALYLRDYLQGPGRYVGIDVNRRAIRWATRHIARTRPNFQFIHIDVNNQAYNPRGSIQPREGLLSMGDSKYDIVLFKSVLTHLTSGDARQYLLEVARLLRPGGVCLTSVFALDDDYDAGNSKAEGASIGFEYGRDDWRFAVKQMPELAVAFYRRDMEQWITSAGLAIERFLPGTWSGFRDGLSFQDLLIIRPRI